MGLPKMKPSERTRSEAMIHIMNFSRAGAVIQLAVMHALGEAYPDNLATRHRPGESNEDVVKRLIAADALLGRQAAFDGVKAYGEEVVKLGRDGLRAAFGDTVNLINPDAWFTACEDIVQDLGAAVPDPEPTADDKPADVDLRVTLRDARGVQVETDTGPAAEMIAKAMRFMISQGTDPDGDGENAQPGRISFEPA